MKFWIKNAPFLQEIDVKGMVLMVTDHSNRKGLTGKRTAEGSQLIAIMIL